MAAFTGKYYYSVDPKGRVMIPAPFREIIAAAYSPRLYITVAAVDKCVQVYPLEEWTELLRRVRTLPRNDKNVKRFMREVIGSAVEAQFDKQGRVQLPASLRQDLGIGGDVVIVGQLERIEVWDKAMWERSIAFDETGNDTYEKSLSDLGL